MRTISASVDIAASPEEVWAVLADLGSYGQWNPFIQSAAGRFAVGEKLTLRLVPSQGLAKTFRPQVLVVKPGIMLRWIGRLLVPGIFDGTHQFALDELDGHTRVTQSEKFRGILIPFTGKTITQTETDFNNLNQALKQRVEARQ